MWLPNKVHMCLLAGRIFLTVPLAFFDCLIERLVCTQYEAPNQTGKKGLPNILLASLLSLPAFRWDSFSLLVHKMLLLYRAVSAYRPTDPRTSHPPTTILTQLSPLWGPLAMMPYFTSCPLLLLKDRLLYDLPH